MALPDDIKIHAGKLAIVKETPLSKEDIESIEKGVVIKSRFGLSMCFYLKAGGRTYFPLTSDSKVRTGRIADINNIIVVELAKPGKDSTYRLKIK